MGNPFHADDETGFVFLGFPLCLKDPETTPAVVPRTIQKPEVRFVRAKPWTGIHPVIQGKGFVPDGRPVVNDGHIDPGRNGRFRLTPV